MVLYNYLLKLTFNNGPRSLHSAVHCREFNSQTCKFLPSLRSLARRNKVITEVSRVKVGCEVRGLQLADINNFSDRLKEEIKQLVHDQRLVVFKDQGTVSGQTHIEISRWFGSLDSSVPIGDPLYTHPKSPHPIIHRISNDAEEGCTDAGRSGWHIDGSLLQKPFGYALYHMAEVPKTGATEFIGFSELLESIPAEMRRRWDRLWSVPDKGEKHVHPLIYRHPVTELPVMCMHLGMIEAFIYDKNTALERETDRPETWELIEEITNEIEKDGKRLVYAHEWQEGDFIISDNLAVGHFASANSQRPRSQIGLRVLHRTTTRGTNIPCKATDTEHETHE